MYTCLSIICLGYVVLDLMEYVRPNLYHKPSALQLCDRCTELHDKVEGFALRSLINSSAH